jgi:formylglycine-generating enzyme required for sulfatase activity
VVSGARKLKLVILDACRNNPLGERIILSSGVARSFRGLARIEPKGEVLVAYAAKAGKLALDGVGRHSPYAQALLEHMATPGLDVIRMFGRVKETVLDATQGAQEPWIYGSPGGEAIALVPGLVAPPHPVTRQQRVAEARQAFEDAKGSEQRLAAVAERYKDTIYGDYARQELKRLQDEREKIAHAMPPVAPVPPAALNAGSVFRDCPNVCPEMVVVPAGSFMMGSPPGEDGRNADEGPQRRVTISRPFALGKFEVTFDEWDACLAAGGCKHNPSDFGWGRGRRSVINVSWNDAKEYAAWLSDKTGKTYRLPTEAEWEYAARGGKASLKYWWGNDASHEYANYGTDRCCNGFAAGRDRWVNTAPVGQFPANPFGLHDMHGNVFEWVEDCYEDSYKGAPSDGSARTSGRCDARVFRQCSWRGTPRLLRSASRGWLSPWNRADDGGGFRVARTL